VCESYEEEGHEEGEGPGDCDSSGKQTTRKQKKQEMKTVGNATYSEQQTMNRQTDKKKRKHTTCNRQR
jgi:hypothetical protein